MLVTELDYNKMYMDAFNDGFKQGSEVERKKVLDEVKNTIERMYPPLAVDLMKALKKL